MDTRPWIPSRSYEDFVPTFHWNQEEGSVDTLVLSLPRFNKEQLKVQRDNFGNLRVSGERPLGSSERWSRFREDFKIPENISTADIRAKHENGNLYITFPKLFARPQNKPPKAQVSESSKKPSTDQIQPKPREEQDTTIQRNKPPSFSKSSRSSKEPSEPTDAMKTAPTVQEKEKDQTHESLRDKKATSEYNDEDGEIISNLRKRKKDGVEKVYDAGVGMRFKKPRQLMVNVGVAVVILVGLAFYVSYKLKKSI